MPKLVKSKKVKDEVLTDVNNVEDAVDGSQLSDSDVINVTGDDGVLSQYVDPQDFIYNVQAGKNYSGFSAMEAIQFAHVMLGKVDKIVISKAK